VLGIAVINESVTYHYLIFAGVFDTFSCVTDEDEMGIEKRIAIFMLITSLIGLGGCQELGDNDAMRVKAEIEASVKQASKAWEGFPKSMDRASLLKYYAPDYSGVKDGASETLKDLEKSFDDLAEQIKLG
jgi:hypothetical protein